MKPTHLRRKAKANFQRVLFVVRWYLFAGQQFFWGRKCISLFAFDSDAGLLTGQHDMDAARACSPARGAGGVLAAERGHQRQRNALGQRVQGGSVKCTFRACETLPTLARRVAQVQKLVSCLSTCNSCANLILTAKFKMNRA